MCCCTVLVGHSSMLTQMLCKATVVSVSWSYFSDVWWSEKSGCGGLSPQQPVRVELINTPAAVQCADQRLVCRVGAAQWASLWCQSHCQLYCFCVSMCVCADMGTYRCMPTFVQVYSKDSCSFPGSWKSIFQLYSRTQTCCLTLNLYSVWFFFSPSSS